MKKLLSLILIVIMVFAVSACTSKIEDSDTSNLSPIATVEESKTISVEEAVELFKEDPYAEVEGYTLDDAGWLSKKGEGSIGNIHMLGLDSETELFCIETNRWFAFSLTENLITKYSYGEVVATALIPENSIYCGMSEGNGFIFRKEDTVLSINFDLSEITTIATGVKLVIDTNYEYNSDAWSQPLLLMKDGSIKVYVQWEENLLDPYYEGGYGGTLIEK